jgi:hypothetical protein
MFIRGFIAETGNPFCCVQHTDTRGEITIRVLGLNDERLSGPRLDAYKEGYDAMSEVFEWRRSAVHKMTAAKWFVGGRQV